MASAVCWSPPLLFNSPRVELYAGTRRRTGLGNREVAIGDDDEKTRKQRDRERFRERQRERDSETQRNQRREAIKEAATEIFAERGYHQTKVSEIVDEVGVAQGTFYLHFDGKKQIFEEILSDFLSLFLETVANWEPEELDSRDDLRRELTRMGNELTEIVSDRQQLAAIYFKESTAERPEFDSLIRDFHEGLIATLSQFNRVLHERGLIESARYDMLANMTIGMVERIIREYVVYDEFEDVPHEELVQHLVVHYLSGTREPLDD